MFDRLVHTFNLGLRNIILHKLRSTLTIMGIVLGVASVIVMLAVGEAAKHESLQQLRDLGATNLIVRSVKPIEDNSSDQSRYRLVYGLTLADMDRIAATIPTVTSATPLREFRRELRFLERSLEGRVVSVTPDYKHLTGLELAQGRFISQLDNDQFANVCVLGSETAEVLFPFEDPMGQSITISGTRSFTVIGVAKYRAPSGGIGGSLAGENYNRDVYIPFSSDQVRFGDTLVYHGAGTRQIEKLEISQLTVAVDHLDHVRETAHIIKGLLDQFHPQKDTAITVPLDLLEKAEQTQRLFTLVLGAIASISLLVGGIGIMNIMLATVTERTREIGIRRALGAKKHDVTSQFLVETVVLSGIGGLLGVGAGIGLSILLTYFFDFPTIIEPWSPMVAFGVSVGVGLLFGTYPAKRAAQMDPVEALRHE